VSACVSFNCLAWKQLDRNLADTHFKFLQKLEFSIEILPGDNDAHDSLDSTQYSSVCTSIVAAFPLLAERGVSMSAYTRFIEFKGPTSCYCLLKAHKEGLQ
jgi:hypothetical protein